MPQDKIIGCIWYEKDAEAAAEFYISLIPDSRILDVFRTPADTPSGPAGQVLTVDFVLAGQRYVGLNGGPHFRLSEAFSIQVMCDRQEEIDRLTEALSAVPEAEQCGWVKDRWGLSWQIVPRILPKLISDPDPARARRAMEAMLQMKRLNIAELERAADGR